MKIKFDPNQKHQQNAWEASVDVFEGQENEQTIFTMPSFPNFNQLDLIQSGRNIEKGFGNRLLLLDEQILENVQKIQLKNGLKQTRELNKFDFKIEMETGTGKTYVYLRSIFEMNKKYGFSKFIIIVPSLAIKEGVYKSLQMMESHLKGIYENIPFDFFVYNSSRLEQVRSFASNSYLQIMIINIDSFRKSLSDKVKENRANIIHRWNDKIQGVPIDLIKATNPILIIDEPQTVDTTIKSQEAISSLNSLSTFRYSATHVDKNNMLFKLDSIDAYEKKLVKQIEVASLEVLDSHNNPYIRLLEVDNTNSHRARVEVDIQFESGVKRKIKWVKQNTDLFEDVTKRSIYEGYIINDICCEEGNEYIDFQSKEEILRLNEVIGNVDENKLKRIQIRKTIEEHLNKEIFLNKLNIKVLSLIFIDKVANYRNYQNRDNKGNYAIMFEEEYANLIKKPKYKCLFLNGQREALPEEVHDGYFSQDKKGKITDTKGTTIADENTFNLIMKDKEKLLNFNSKLRFIFSHSALKEGWDNPNVFQICTLNETKSVIKKRQEIGRGLRIAVDQNGERVHGFDVNTLTVMANESYEDFVKGLQKEIEDDEGIKFGVVFSHSFSKILVLLENGEQNYLGQEVSENIWQNLLERNYIDEQGKVLDKLKVDLKENKFFISDNYDNYLPEIVTVLKKISRGLKIKNNSNKHRVDLNKKVFDSSDFINLWNRIKYKTSYKVNYNSEKLIKNCADKINKELIVNSPKIKEKVVKVAINRSGLEVSEPIEKTKILETQKSFIIPEILTILQNDTNLKRKSIFDILIQSKRLSEFKKNPQKFIDQVSNIIKRELRNLTLEGISYEIISKDNFYNKDLFETEELFGFVDQNLLKAKKSTFEYVVYDSDIESSLAQYFENSDDVKVYSKLPSWFKIDTPFGSYNPDWAVLFQLDEMQKLYFVLESKGNTTQEELRGAEKAKINCAIKHFKALGNESKFLTVSNADTFNEQAINNY